MKFQKEFERFQSLLKELFQFEASDLDFGIYRILNYKREQIKDFILLKIDYRKLWNLPLKSISKPFQKT